MLDKNGMIVLETERKKVREGETERKKIKDREKEKKDS